MLSSLQFSDLQILRHYVPFVSLCDWGWLCACRQFLSNTSDQSIVLAIHTHILYPLHYPLYSSPLSPPPPFQQGNSMHSNFFQMSRTSRPSFSCFFPFVLNFRRVGSNPDSPPLLIFYLSTFVQHVGLNDKTWPWEVTQERRGWSASRAERNAEANAFPTLHDVLVLLQSGVCSPSAVCDMLCFLGFNGIV